MKGDDEPVLATGAIDPPTVGPGKQDTGEIGSEWLDTFRNAHRPACADLARAGVWTNSWGPALSLVMLEAYGAARGDEHRGIGLAGGRDDAPIR